MRSEEFHAYYNEFIQQQRELLRLRIGKPQEIYFNDEKYITGVLEQDPYIKDSYYCQEKETVLPFLLQQVAAVTRDGKIYILGYSKYKDFIKDFITGIQGKVPKEK